ncbi:MAG: hypothetical protein H0W93_05350 [Gammaproteobacteria bacterium]|nr:hypothetical protein [Gammaproteobacteria bacterium]
MNAAQATPTVFVVDDDRTFLGALLLALESADLAVETFVSAPSIFWKNPSVIAHC